MFRRKKQPPKLDVSRLSALVGESMKVVGDIQFTGGLRVDGRVQGNVVGETGDEGLLVLSDRGTIVGNVHVHDAVVNGTIEGDLFVGRFLELQPGARVVGSISYNELQMECGATVEGKLLRREQSPASIASGATVALPAPPMVPLSLQRS
ncbi:MAG: polymer-forming cytoskeletal protein [Gammaproteobacteria bacterium]|nr:polymer-forming cytoskeletal protein [Gammaproteobacteria bacterium]